MDTNSMGCTSKANWKCSMCWDYCEGLAVYARTRAQMCADDICLEGCQHACKFMQETSTSTSSTPDAKIVSPSAVAEKPEGLQLAEPTVAKTGVVISWTMSGDKLTFVVFGLTTFYGMANPAWEEIQQTTEHRVILPMDAKYEEIVVAAFDGKGLVQKADKKMVFQLRTKRAVAQFEEKRLGKIGSSVSSNFTVILFVSVIVVIVLLAIIVKSTKNTFFNKVDEPIVWV